jgi:hypothetical protein
MKISTKMHSIRLAASNRLMIQENVLNLNTETWTKVSSLISADAAARGAVVAVSAVFDVP